MTVHPDQTTPDIYRSLGCQPETGNAPLENMRLVCSQQWPLVGYFFLLFLPYLINWIGPDNYAGGMIDIIEALMLPGKATYPLTNKPS